MFTPDQSFHRLVTIDPMYKVALYNVRPCLLYNFRVI